MFSFYHRFLLLFFECFYFTNFLYCNCFFFVRYFMFVLLYRECYGFERAFFYSLAFFSSDSFHTFATVPQGLRICVSPFYCQAFFYLTLIPHICQSTASATYFKEPFLLSGVSYLTLLPHICHSTASASDMREHFLFSEVFTLHSFLTFGTTCFYQDSLESRQFSLEGRRSGACVCLNRTVFSKRY